MLRACSAAPGRLRRACRFEGSLAAGGDRGGCRKPGADRAAEAAAVAAPPDRAAIVGRRRRAAEAVRSMDAGAGAGGLTLPDIERELARGPGALRFDRGTERAFDRHERLTRTRYLVVSGAIGCACYVGFLAVDWQLMRDVFALSCVLRLAVFTPLGAVMLLVTARAESTVLREGSRAALTVVATAIVVALDLASRSPYRCAFLQGTILIMLHVVVLRLRFRYAVATVAGTLAALAAAVFGSDAFDGRMRVADPLMFLSGAVFLLGTVYGVEREARSGFLSSLRASLLQAELERNALHDPLTGLGNRRRLDARLREAWEGSAAGAPVSLVILDVDHFKKLNDACGHMKGDACLVRVAEALGRALAGTPGEAFRFGGEEFVVLLPGVDRARAVATAEDLVRAVRDEAMPHPALGPGSVVTASAGVAVGDARLTGPQELLRAADGALYAAKEAGRDMVRVRTATDGGRAPSHACVEAA